MEGGFDTLGDYWSGTASCESQLDQRCPQRESGLQEMVVETARGHWHPSSVGPGEQSLVWLNPGSTKLVDRCPLSTSPHWSWVFSICQILRVVVRVKGR